MDDTLAWQLAGAGAYGLFTFTLGYLICKFGLSTLVKDVENLKIQSPIAVAIPVATPVVAPVATIAN